MDVLVIGAGVSGLTSALRLLRSGRRVTIWAKALPPNTTSNVAAAVWMPYAVQGQHEDDVRRWGKISLDEFTTLAQTPDTGIVWRDVLDIYPKPNGATPTWAESLATFRSARPDELAPGYTQGYAFSAPVIDMSIYLDYLRRTFEAEGGRIHTTEVRNWHDVFPANWRVVVNCAGLGARALATDDTATTADSRGVHAGRGQVVRVRVPGGFSKVLTDDTDPERPTYIVPRLHDIVLGGFNQPNEQLEPDQRQTLDILRRCAQLASYYDPTFAASLRALASPSASGTAPRAEIVSIGVGLRPVRHTVRLEARQVLPGRYVIHNYGHGGAGVTLSWGCAADVAQLVEEVGGASAPLTAVAGA